MAIFGDLFDDKPDLTVKRQIMFEQSHTAFDADGRHWPKPLTMPRDRTNELEDTITKLSAELNLRCTQVADLYNLRQQKDADLLHACDEIDRLSKTIEALQDALARHENDGAADKQKFALLDKENVTLRLQLEKVTKDSAYLLQRLLDVETVLNDQNVALVSARDSNAQMKVELTAAQAEVIKLTAATEEADQQHHNEFNRQVTQLTDKIKKLEGTAAHQAAQVKELEEARAKLASRCDELSETVTTLENEKKNSREKFIAQSVEILETLMKVERDTADAKIKELTTELEEERSAHSAAERASAGIRENIVQLLPKLVALRSRPDSSEPDTPLSRTDAA